MKSPVRSLLVFSALLGLAALSPAVAADAKDAKVYELRTYTATPGKIENVISRFRDHTTRIFDRFGMVSVGYWIPIDQADGAGEKIVYLLEHKSREAADAAWKAFQADPEWQTVSKASEANGRIVAKVDRVYLALTDYSPAPAPSTGKSPRVFELRTYTAPDGKLEALDARFRGGETALFAKAGMHGVAYFHPTDANKGVANTLIYLLVHDSREAATASWAKFRADPEWVKMKEASEKDGKLTTETKSMFLAPLDFSKIK